MLVIAWLPEVKSSVWREGTIITVVKTRNYNWLVEHIIIYFEYQIFMLHHQSSVNETWVSVRSPNQFDKTLISIFQFKIFFLSIKTCKLDTKVLKVEENSQDKTFNFIHPKHFSVELIELLVSEAVKCVTSLRQRADQQSQEDEPWRRLQPLGAHVGPTGWLNDRTQRENKSFYNIPAKVELDAHKITNCLLRKHVSAPSSFYTLSNIWVTADDLYL